MEIGAVPSSKKKKNSFSFKLNGLKSSFMTAKIKFLEKPQFDLKTMQKKPLAIP